MLIIVTHYHQLNIFIQFDSCLEQVRSNGIELTAPLAESGKESALLKSRKRIVPNHKNVHIPTQQIPTLAETDLHQDFINKRLKGFFLVQSLLDINQLLKNLKLLYSKS